MKKILLLICLLITGSKIFAQQNYYSQPISKDLLYGANAVIRDEETSVEVKDLTDVVYRVKKVITILNKNGDNMAPIVVEHDKFKAVKSIKGEIYNAVGTRTGKFSESNFEDVSGYDGFSLFNDFKIKHYTPATEGYPYTIAYEIEYQFKQTLFFYDWEPARVSLAVENATYTFTCKPDFNIRYKEMHLPEKGQVTTNSSGQTVYSWRLTNIKAFRSEPFGEAHLPKVKISPQSFSYGGMKGAFTTWQDLGKWEYDHLLINRDQLSPETVTHVQEMVANITDPKEKAKKIYEYMQQRTHYVSVQIGIGGFQPFLAADVDQLNYGDCKGLVNYTHALLKAVGIESYYCVVTAGKTQKTSMMKDFPGMNQGNHAILCLPFKNDTTWAECTSQTIPFGYLGDFTDDRAVLAVTPDGGKLMHTPKYSADDNLRSRKAEFVIGDDGKLSGTMVTIFKGTDYENREKALTDNNTDRIKGLKSAYAINNVTFESVDFKEDKSPHPAITESLKLSASDFATTSDGRFNFPVNPVNRLNTTLREVRNRVSDVHIIRGYTIYDEITYTLPKGYHLDSKTIDINIDKPFGNYTATLTLNGNQLIYKRKSQLKQGTFSGDTYQDMVDFFQTVYDADSYNVSLVKNN
ncbi:DUF3857 domain-containing protein [Mucilaginibacter sp. X4EP1]|uniref:DUF3857 domain-containing protein n=1 Tax=Mucilaginibacter sp. X4EP1 TaxID=2723092 RepID=UPI002168841D|nr:DUF3857 domain-containing protein [Mucilaginibacter sp. X4EP1]MCS3813509.1 hypothetical protein [Mucilaginibacter sp. X4EP1]